MKTELYKAIKAINIENLNEDDKEELLRIFMVTKDALIRNKIAFIFSDLKFNKAIPYIIKKINAEYLYHNNASLVYSLENMDTKKYFIELIKIICKHEYEPRLIAYGIVQNLAASISNKNKSKALNILEDYRLRLEQEATDKGENSALHFVEKTKELLMRN